MATLPIDICNSGLLLLGESAIAAQTTTISGATATGSALELTVGLSSNFRSGQLIYVSDLVPADWNGYYTITNIPDSTHIWVASFSSESYVSGGSIEQAMPYDGSKAAATFTALWPYQILGATLKLHPWNSLKTRVSLTQPSLTISGGTITTGVLTLTVGANTLQVGQTVYISGTVTSGGTWDGTYIITGQTATTISFSVGFTDTYISGGVVNWAPLMDFSYIYNLPTNILRPLRINLIGLSNFYSYQLYGGFYMVGQTMAPYRIEGDFLLCSEMVVYLLYMQWDNVNFTVPQDPILISLLSAQAASRLAMPITRDLNVKKTLDDDFKLNYLQAKIQNAQGQTPEEFPESTWITNRY